MGNLSCRDCGRRTRCMFRTYRRARALTARGVTGFGHRRRLHGSNRRLAGRPARHAALGAKHREGLTQGREAVLQNQGTEAHKPHRPRKITHHAVPLWSPPPGKKTTPLYTTRLVSAPALIIRKDLRHDQIMPIPQNLGAIRIKGAQAISQAHGLINTCRNTGNHVVLIKDM